MKRSEYEANDALMQRAKAARMTTACLQDNDPVGIFHGLYWAIWGFLVVAAVVSSLTVTL